MLPMVRILKENFSILKLRRRKVLLDHHDQTIKDFGEQWLKYTDNEGYYGSLELFEDILSPFLRPNEIKGCKVAEIGSGTGRIANMVLAAGVRHVIAVEPSDAFKVLIRNIVDPERVTCLKITGDQLPPYGDLDYIFSIGVLHHVRDPGPVVRAAFRALRPGGRFLVWLYGKEGNSLYLLLLKPLRIITKHLPHFILATLVEIIYWPVAFYVKLCRRFPLPLRGYMLWVFERFSPGKRRLALYDQLNPSYAKYYSQKEAKGLLGGMGFANVLVHHRHGYSWTVIGTKP
jgi:SAM-dependent methyltransferase